MYVEVNLELQQGEVAVLHNWTIHRSGVNSSAGPRRAFSVNYMLGSTNIVDHNTDLAATGTRTGFAQGSDEFPVVFAARHARA